MRKQSKVFIVGFTFLMALTIVVGFTFLNKNKTEYYHADYPAYDSQTDMENRADIIIEGKILNSHIQIINTAHPIASKDPKENPSKDGKVSKEEGDIVYTVSMVKVNEVFKAQNIKPGDIVEVKQLGGTIDKVTYKDEHTEHFKNEKEYVMFLRDFQDQNPYSLINPSQGYYEKIENKYQSHKENKVQLDIESLKHK